MDKILKKENAKIAAGGALGYFLFWLASHPTRSPLRKRIPQKQYKSISLLPEIKIARKNKEYHLHHWLNISTLYLLIYLKKKRLPHSKFLNGLMLGGIIQGLSYKDRFKIIKKYESEQLIHPRVKPQLLRVADET